jgi:tetratricopeptide (TPR) repeat protein
VLIYFAREPAQQVLAQLGHALAPDGLLVLGASDIVLESPVGLEPTSLNGRLAFRLGHGRFAKSAADVEEKRRPKTAESPLPADERHKRNRTGDSAQSRAGRPEAGSFEAPTEGHGSSAGAATGALWNGKAVRQDDEDLSAHAVEDMLDGIAQYLAGHTAAAVKALRAALFHCSSLWPAAYYLALCCEDLGRFREAKREYQRTIDLISRRAPLPVAAHQDYSFLELDVLRLAEQRISMKRR